MSSTRSEATSRRLLVICWLVACCCRFAPARSSPLTCFPLRLKFLSLNDLDDEDALTAVLEDATD